MQAPPSFQSSAGASPFQVGGSPLFRTAGNEPVAAPPINSASGMSPFSVAGATPTHSPLTVGDVINQLPPEVVRMGALPPEQPLSLPPSLLENALRSGQAALPVFELYRVCPALFQTPISPQDPRMVPLPASKLPGLIAQAREGGAGAPGGAAPSPFSQGQPVPTPHSPAGSPFQMQPPAAEAPGAQQPGGSPFSLGGSPAGSPFSMPPQGGAPAGSPFSLGGSPAGSPFSMPQSGSAAAPATGAPAGSPFSMGGSPAGSPFSMPQQPAAAPNAGAASGSPFSLGGSPAASPFSMPQQPAAAASAPAQAAGSPFSLGGSSPFGQQQPAGASASPATSAGSPFSLGGASGASPFGQPQPQPQPQPQQQPAAGAPMFAPAPAENLSAGSAQPQASISVLFTPQAQQRASTPSDMAAPPPMPFGSPFVSAMKEAASPAEAAPAMNAFASMPAQQQPQQQAPAPAPAPSAPPSNGAPANAMAKLGFAAVLSGHSMDELGFNPTSLPAWITTNVPASVLQEQMSSGNIVVELGLLIDGLSDIGFRNTLTGARRDCRIKLPQNEVFHALTNAAAAPAAAGMLSTPSPAPAAAPAQMRLSVQPNPPQAQHQPQQPAQNSQPLFAPAAPQSAPAPAAAPAMPTFNPALNPFLQNTPAEAPAPALTLNPSQSSGGPPQFSFAAPAAPAPGPSSLIPSFGAPPSSFAPVAAVSAFAPAAPAEPQQAPAQPAGNSFFSPAAAPAPAPAAPSGPIQPLASAFQTTFGKPPASLSSPSSPLAGTPKPFDPFASSATGALAPKATLETGFSSAQLLGQAPPAQQPAALFAPAPEKQPVANFFATPEAPPAFPPAPSPSPSPFQPTPSFAPALEEIPAVSSTAPLPMVQPASRGLFSAAAPAPVAKESKPASAFSPAPAPAPAAAHAPAAAPSKMAAVKHSYLGLAPLDTQTDQLLLRALLGTEENLAAPRVVELLALQTGLSACVCLHGSHVLSHADASKPDAAEFQRQAPDIARQLRGLAPLIGIEGAETFTLNAGGRLLTFCFPGETIIGVLHDAEPSTGMRDKITLIARELSRMLG
ncbi:hypothetical protein [Prosthecobacter sp.]|uniref:hypothetical protein n=1 Tax=Prosthecobacter sp. TaxID=1965333 RepID=UPI003784E532